METSPSVTTHLETLPVTQTLGCPLQQAMEEIAQVAVRQHVLYQEGESQPRLELLERLEAWSSLHRLIRSRICTASRESTMSTRDLERALHTLFSQPEDVATQPLVGQLRISLFTCARATSCPLGAKVAE